MRKVVHEPLFWNHNILLINHGREQYYISRNPEFYERLVCIFWFFFFFLAIMNMNTCRLIIQFWPKPILTCMITCMCSLMRPLFLPIVCTFIVYTESCSWFIDIRNNGNLWFRILLPYHFMSLVHVHLRSYVISTWCFIYDGVNTSLPCDILLI